MLKMGSAATTVFWTKYLGQLINKPISLQRSPSKSLLFWVTQTGIIILLTLFELLIK